MALNLAALQSRSHIMKCYLQCKYIKRYVHWCASILCAQLITVCVCWDGGEHTAICAHCTRACTCMDVCTSCNLCRMPVNKGPQIPQILLFSMKVMELFSEILLSYSILLLDSYVINCLVCDLFFKQSLHQSWIWPRLHPGDAAPHSSQSIPINSKLTLGII